jgi:putative aldouronate transport system permease protein
MGIEAKRKKGWRKLAVDVWNARLLYLLLIPGLIQMFFFKLAPLFGLSIAFQDFSTFRGILGSDWVGLKHFMAFLQDPYTWKLVKNTLLLALMVLFFAFPVPVIFALFLNEVRQKLIRKFVQSLSFFPYFISSAVLVSIMYTVLSPQGGIVNQFLGRLGAEPVFFMAEPGWFRPLYTGLHIWQTFGYYAIVYLAAMTAIDPTIYEVAEIDGANRWQKMFYITIPSVSTTIVTMFIVSVGAIFTVDLDKILLMYNPSVYETADVIQSFVYRTAFASQGFPNYSYGAAVSLVQSVIAFGLVVLTNWLSKKYAETRLF